MNRPDLVVIHHRACAAHGIRYGTTYSAGSWIVTEDGALHVLADGTVMPRPTPWPWTRPSIAALPTVRVTR